MAKAGASHGIYLMLITILIDTIGFGTFALASNSGTMVAGILPIARAARLAR